MDPDYLRSCPLPPISAIDDQKIDTVMEWITAANSLVKCFGRTDTEKLLMMRLMRWHFPDMSIKSAKRVVELVISINNNCE